MVTMRHKRRIPRPIADLGHVLNIVLHGGCLTNGMQAAFLGFGFDSFAYCLGSANIAGLSSPVHSMSDLDIYTSFHGFRQLAQAKA